jgi:hypothetical protein
MSSYSVDHQPTAKMSYQAAAHYVAKTQVANQPHLNLKPLFQLEVSQAKRALESIAELDDDWDGYGAKLVSRIVRLNAWHALDHFLGSGLVPDITPNPNGTVSFDWNVAGARSHFEVGKTRYSMFVETQDGTTRFLQGEAGSLSADLISALASTVQGPNPTQSVTPISYTGSRDRTAA